MKKKKMKKRRIKHNNLLPWFTQDHGTLPASYLKSCKKFFKELKRSSKNKGWARRAQAQQAKNNG